MDLSYFLFCQAPCTLVTIYIQRQQVLLQSHISFIGPAHHLGAPVCLQPASLLMVNEHISSKLVVRQVVRFYTINGSRL